MQYIIIKFPFSSVNDNQYVLAVCLNAPDVSAARSAILADREVFKPEATQLVGGETVYNFTGTLTGSVKAVDDDRKDMFEPLVRSKLAFNVAVQTFPEWLFEYCATNRAKAIVYYVEGGVWLHEMWRGYLIGQTLNMTVVRNLLSVSLVAVDEVAMASHMNFKATLRYVTNDSWCSLYGLMRDFHDLHHTRGIDSTVVGFEKIYQILGLSSTNQMLWHRDMRVIDDDDNTVTNIPQTLVVNLDRWLQDEDATWENVFDDLFRYLCVTFAVGSYGLMTVNDAYLVTCPNDLPSYTQYVYSFVDDSYTTHSYSVYATISNPQKVGANFQMTEETDKYKEVQVTSKPERWESHDYLTEEHYKEIDPSKSVRYVWGATKDQVNGPFDEFGWHKLIYLKPDAKESDYLTIEPCADGEGLIMARNGILPYDDLDSCVNMTEPESSVADSLDFITFKEGCCVVMIGGGKTGGIDEDNELKRYFLLMNHMWGNMVNMSAYTMQSIHIADTPWVRFRPLGTVAPVHPSDKHYLKIKMAVTFIRENMPIGSTVDGNPHMWNWFPAVGVGNSMTPVTWASPAMIMPSTETVFDFEETDGPYHGAFNGGLTFWNRLYFKAYIHIGSFYFNGSAWVYVGANDTPPTCDVTMLNQTSTISEIDKFGFISIETKNYYYTISSPCLGNNSMDKVDDPKMLIDMSDISVHNAPCSGQLEIVVLGQIAFESTNGAAGNSIPFVLIKDVEIGYTDDAEILDNDIESNTTITLSLLPTKEVLKRELAMYTPMVPGFFSNALVFDNGKAWNNLTYVEPQSMSIYTTPERMIANKLADQYSGGQLFVEFETPVNFDDNVHNVCFVVQNLTEADGRFLPVKREFDYTLERMRVKMMRINTRIN